MNLYDDPTTVATPPALPAAGTPGHCTDGVPGVTPRTILRAWIIDALISEVVAPSRAQGSPRTGPTTASCFSRWRR